MNRFILKYAYPITFVILAILAWAAYRQFSMGWSSFITYAIVAVIVWGVGTVVFIYFWPTITYSAFKRAAVQHGLGGGRSLSIRCTPCLIAYRLRRQTRVSSQRGPTTCSTSAACSTSPKGRLFCTCRT